MRIRLAALTSVILVAVGCGGGDEPEPTFPGAAVKVMTRNLYLGADLAPVITARGPDDIPVKVAALWKTVEASDVPGRMKAVAAEIATAKPDLVGLQEAVTFRLQKPTNFSFGNPTVDAQEVKYDFLKLILAELAARGLVYRVIEHELSDVEFPSDADGGGERFDLRVTDRDAILVREGITPGASRTVKYDNYVPVPVGGVSADGKLTGTGLVVKLLRGYVTVPVTMDGATFLFGTTHLEVDGALSQFQEAQAREIERSLGNAAGNIILVGDFNSRADGKGSRSYAGLVGRFNDAWTKTRPLESGFTCCTRLAADPFKADERIDIVFMRGGVRALATALTGVDPALRTEGTNLWPTDHAGVTADLLVRR